MAPRTFFKICIKLLGIYMVLASVTVVLPQMVTVIFTFGDLNSPNDTKSLLLPIVVIIFTIGLLYLMLHLCLLKTDWVVNKLALDKNFPEENFAINMHRSTILKISIIVIGGFVIIDGLPGLCQNIYRFVCIKGGLGINQPMGILFEGWIVLYCVKIIIGFLLIRYNRQLVNFIEYERKK